MNKYAKLTVWLIGAWFVFSIAASALHFYRSGPNDPPLPLGLAAAAPLVIFGVWFAASANFREFAMTLNPKAMTFVQSWRIVGFVFLVLATYGVLPKAFALPAGWGDMFIGATAPLVAWKLAIPGHRRTFLLWQVLGMIDLVMAVTLGTLAQLIDHRGIPTTAMTVLPLSMIPTFAVPLLLIVHFVCVAQARRWPAQPRAEGRNTLSPAA
jgi:hypothetical protein